MVRNKSDKKKTAQTTLSSKEANRKVFLNGRRFPFRSFSSIRSTAHCLSSRFWAQETKKLEFLDAKCNHSTLQNYFYSFDGDSTFRAIFE